MDQRALGALVGVALSAIACGYDYVDRRAAVEGEAPTAAEAARAACHAGEPVADAVSASGGDVLARPESFAKSTIRLRGALKSRAEGGERLVTKGGEIALDLSQLPPWWIDTCGGKDVEVDGTVAVAPRGGGEGGPPIVLRAVALVGAAP